MVALCAVFLNVIFGVQPPGCSPGSTSAGPSSTSPIDLPFAISPVVDALMYMLLFGRQGFLGAMAQRSRLPLVFNFTGLC